MALVVLAIAPSVGAQCAFEHPKKAAKFEASLVQAFVPCECYEECLPFPPFTCTLECGNTTTEGGVTACEPPETWNEQAGSDPGGWQWDEERSRGSVSMRAKSACTAVSQGTSLPPCDPSSPLNPAGTADVEITLKLSKVISANGAASGTGQLFILARITLDDPAGGDMSMIELPVNIPFEMVDGDAHLKTSLDAFLNDLGGGLPGLPACTNVEIVAISVFDSNGSRFASVGIWLPLP